MASLSPLEWSIPGPFCDEQGAADKSPPRPFKTMPIRS